MTASFSTAELHDAFTIHSTAVAESAATGDWERFVQVFTPDATYADPIVGEMVGHDQIRPWVMATLQAFPGSAMTFPDLWHVVDAERGRVVCELRNVLRDPGDGSSWEQNNISVLTYAGDGRFSREQDVYDSPAFATLIEGWGRRCHELGTLSDDETAWFAAAYPHILEG